MNIKNTKVLIITVMLVVYLAVLLKVLVFRSFLAEYNDISVTPFLAHLMGYPKLRLSVSGATGTHMLGKNNFIPFRTIVRYLTHANKIIALSNLLGNILLFLPLGILLPLVYRSSNWKRILLIAFLLSLCIELLQLIFRVGTFDVDDMLLNTVGGMIGYGIFIIGSRIL